MRVGVLRGGLEIESEKAVPPSEKLRVVSHSELAGLVPHGNSRSDLDLVSPPLVFTGDHGLASSGDEDELPKTPISEVSFELPETKT